MAFDFEIFQDQMLQEGFVEWLTDEKAGEAQRHFGRLRDYTLAQEWGLPVRIVGGSRAIGADTDIQRKEVVIETTSPGASTLWWTSFSANRLPSSARQPTGKSGEK